MENNLSRRTIKEKRGEERGIDRVNGFSDAVFAVAITILILTLDTPSVSDSSQLPSELRAMWPHFLGFLISFVIIGAFWMSHHMMFQYIKRHMSGLLWLNLFFLMFIVLLPFSTDLMSESKASLLSVVFYDLNMIAASLTLSLLWWYASYLRMLVDEDLNPSLRQHLLLNMLSMACVFAASLGVAFVNVSASQYMYFLLIPIGMVLERIRKTGKQEKR